MHACVYINHQIPCTIGRAFRVGEIVNTKKHTKKTQKCMLNDITGSSRMHIPGLLQVNVSVRRHHIVCIIRHSKRLLVKAYLTHVDIKLISNSCVYMLCCEVVGCKS